MQTPNIIYYVGYMECVEVYKARSIIVLVVYALTLSLQSGGQLNSVTRALIASMWPPSAA